MFSGEIERILEEDAHATILLAGEDIDLRSRLQETYGNNLLLATRKTSSWRNHIVEETVADDYAELWLLSKADRVIGTQYSSYSRMAIAYNGNPASFLVSRKGPDFLR